MASSTRTFTGRLCLTHTRSETTCRALLPDPTLAEPASRARLHASASGIRRHAGIARASTNAKHPSWNLAWLKAADRTEHVRATALTLSGPRGPGGTKETLGAGARTVTRRQRPFAAVPATRARSANRRLTEKAWLARPLHRSPGGWFFGRRKVSRSHRSRDSGLGRAIPVDSATVLRLHCCPRTDKPCGARSFALRVRFPLPCANPAGRTLEPTTSKAEMALVAGYLARSGIRIADQASVACPR